MKTCRTCKQEKPLGEFNRKGQHADGTAKLQPDCRDCSRESNRQYRESKSTARQDKTALHSQVMDRAKREANILWAMRHGHRPMQLIAKETGIPPRSVKGILADLRNDGLVKWNRVGGWGLA